MRLLTLRIEKSLMFGGMDGTWVVDSPNGEPVRSVHESYSRGSAWWHVRVDMEKMEVVCMVIGCAGGECGRLIYKKKFALVPGTIVLNDLHISPPDVVRPRASFRPLWMQELMDQYHLRSVRRVDPNGRVHKRFDNGVFTSSIFCDGQEILVREGADVPMGFKVQNATWAVVDYVRYGHASWRVLYTLGKLTTKMTESFEEHGLSRVR